MAGYPRDVGSLLGQCLVDSQLKERGLDGPFFYAGGVAG